MIGIIDLLFYMRSWQNFIQISDSLNLALLLIMFKGSSIFLWEEIDWPVLMSRSLVDFRQVLRYFMH
jgi:hypothetical protein